MRTEFPLRVAPGNTTAMVMAKGAIPAFPGFANPAPVPCSAVTFLPPSPDGYGPCVRPDGHSGVHVTAEGRWFTDLDDESVFLNRLAGLLADAGDVFDV